MEKFNQRLTDQECIHWFKKLFGGIWNQPGLEEIIFFNDGAKMNYYNDLLQKKKGSNKDESKVRSLAGFLGDSLWDIFSNNHSVYLVKDKAEFDIGSFRGCGSFLSKFIEAENSELVFSYMDFYMGHFGKVDDGGKSYGFIFKRLKENGFDWHYAYPELGIVDFSQNKESKMEEYDPNKSMEDKIANQNLLKVLDEINENEFSRIQKSPTPVIIRSYIKVFNKFPDGWIEN